MKRFLPALLLCSCVGSLVDHTGVPITLPDGGPGGTQQCIDTCTTAVQGAAPLCVGSTCTYECNAGLLNTGTACAAVTSVAAGGDHTCAIAGGAVRCWGDNGQKQLGADTPAFTGIPVGPTLPANARQVAASTTQTCALLDDNSVWCWGLGSASPHTIAGIAGTVTAIAAGAAHACAATASAVYCWGDNAFGQLGPGAAHATAAAVPGVPGATALAAGLDHTCAATGTQTWCWGANDRGQCGNNSFTSPAAPATVSGTGGAFLGSGEAHTCSGASPSGSLACWGANASDQIDNSGADLKQAKGVRSGSSAVAGGAGHTCLIDTGDVLCWGLNDNGQLGTGDYAIGVNSPTRTLVSGATRIAAGSRHTCALLNSGGLECWGANDKGQLGDGTISANSPTPVPATGR